MATLPKPVTIAIIVATLALLAVGGLFFARSRYKAVPELRTEVTIDKNPQWHVHFLKARLSAVQREGNQVRLTGSIYGSPEPLTRVVSTGFQFDFPDDHGTSSYTIARIEADGVVIDYESTFDHTSFGRRLITRDTGSIKLTWFDSTTDATTGEPAEAQAKHWSPPQLRIKLLPQSTCSADVPMIIEKATAYFSKNFEPEGYWPQPSSVTEYDNHWWVKFTRKVKLVVRGGREEFAVTVPGVVTCRVEKAHFTVSVVSAR